MTDTEIQELFERLGRLVSATREHRGHSTSWDFTFPDGAAHHYIIRGLKSPADIEDSAFNLVIWIWNAKDYLKTRAYALGRDGQTVEHAANDNIDLAVCADLANRLKHGRLDRGSRSGFDPRFGKVAFRAPKTALGSLTFRAFEVEVDFSDPDQIEFRLPVLDCKGDEIGDAFKYADNALKALEQLRDDIEEAV